MSEIRTCSHQTVLFWLSHFVLLLRLIKSSRVISFRPSFRWTRITSLSIWIYFGRPHLSTKAGSWLQVRAPRPSWRLCITSGKTSSTTARSPETRIRSPKSGSTFSVTTWRKAKRFLNKAFRLVVWSSFVFASNNCYWPKQITWFILANHSCCLQKQMEIELQVEKLYLTVFVKMFLHRTVVGIFLENDLDTFEYKYLKVILFNCIQLFKWPHFLEGAGGGLHSSYP